MNTLRRIVSFFGASALLTVSVALAQQQPEITQQQAPQQAPTMTPEDARDEQEMVPEDAIDTPAPRQNRGAVRGGEATATATQDTAQNAPAANPAAQTTPAPQPQQSRDVNVLAGTAPADCWAKLYYADNFVGNNVILLGPADVPEMEATFRSVEIGPGATLILFNETNFADESGRFEPGRKAATPEQAPGLEGFESLRITCTGARTG